MNLTCSFDKDLVDYQSSLSFVFLSIVSFSPRAVRAPAASRHKKIGRLLSAGNPVVGIIKKGSFQVAGNGVVPRPSRLYNKARKHLIATF
jgi:hypothetical protein